jgi:hypothetical protein
MISFPRSFIIKFNRILLVLSALSTRVGVAHFTGKAQAKPQGHDEYQNCNIAFIHI